jgi:hypothetical protein
MAVRNDFHHGLFTFAAHTDRSAPADPDSSDCRETTPGTVERRGGAPGIFARRFIGRES